MDVGGIFSRVFGPKKEKQEKRKNLEPHGESRLSPSLLPIRPAPPPPPPKRDSSLRSNDSSPTSPPPPPHATTKPTIIFRSHSLSSLIPLRNTEDIGDSLKKDGSEKPGNFRGSTFSLRQEKPTFPFPPVWNIKDSLEFLEKRGLEEIQRSPPHTPIITVLTPKANDSGVSSLDPEKPNDVLQPPVPIPKHWCKPPTPVIPPSPKSNSPISPKPSLASTLRPGPLFLRNDATTVSNIPSSSNTATIAATPSPEAANAARKASFNVEDDELDVFYETDCTLIRHLQKGGQGSVDLVSTKFYKNVALKKFDRRVQKWETAAIRELSTLLKAVTHPNIVQTRGVLYASPSERNTPLGVLMEFMDEGSVSDAIYDYSSEYPISISFNWCLQASSALAFLHRRKLIHRDVKPGNMLLSDGGKTLKISDFGFCARILSEMTAEVGTLMFMAPEVITIHAKRATYDAKCDVYSLGISLWEMIHRRPPYEGVGVLALMNSVRIGARPPIDKDMCRSNEIKLIERMWMAKPDDRPNMEEVHEELEKILVSLGFSENC